MGSKVGIRILVGLMSRNIENLEQLTCCVAYRGEDGSHKRVESPS